MLWKALFLPCFLFLFLSNFRFTLLQQPIQNYLSFPFSINSMPCLGNTCVKFVYYVQSTNLKILEIALILLSLTLLVYYTVDLHMQNNKTATNRLCSGLSFLHLHTKHRKYFFILLVSPSYFGLYNSEWYSGLYNLEVWIW